jgi:hypothetical protein
MAFDHRVGFVDEPLALVDAGTETLLILLHLGRVTIAAGETGLFVWQKDLRAAQRAALKD